uniref:Zona pellucida glycoprotein 3f, tandem duplicate 2 n=1 Tax=Gasterosteus aculeatus aculeatus TaxID=481459 RepID=G3PMB1_GASAC|nr:zona pellucida sperm-binding protein 3-like [Gasterosteus aculeatus aculeatus]
MVAILCLGVILLVAYAKAVASSDIKVVCGKDFIRIKWKISAELVPKAARLFLGTCMATTLNVLPSGEGEVYFNQKLADCQFQRLITRKYVTFANEMTYRPEPRSKPAAFVHAVQCVYLRPPGIVPSSLNPGYGVSEGRGNLVFHMALLDEKLSSVAKSNVITLGALLPIWATVEQKSHQPLLLLMEECVATSTPELHAGSAVHPIIGNKGCLLESMTENSLFLPRYQTSAVTLVLQAFQLGHGEEVYIHCKLVAWDPDALDETNKACHYKKESMRWELLDDPSNSSICSCCDSTCASRFKRGVELDHGFSHFSVLGPLIIMDPSDSKANMSMESVPAP